MKKFKKVRKNKDLSRRFFVFAIAEYYPSGGLDDVIGTFDTYEEAEKMAADLSYDWVMIWDKVENHLWARR